MALRTFELKTPFIPLMSLLKASGLAQTGGHAGILVEEEEVFVNGEIETRKRRKLLIGDVISVNGIDEKIEIIAQKEA